MIRVKISNFIKKHKNKIQDLGMKLVMVAMGVLMATTILSSLSKSNNTDNDDELSNVYKPTETIIKGSDISSEQYEKDSNLVNKFLDYCNNGEIESAYNLLTAECKEELYPTIEEFREHYCNYIFDKKRQCNLQAWISTSNYIVYRVRYTNDMLATGTYDENDVYQDYITLSKKGDKEEISIGSFIDSEECNIITKTKEITATVINKKTYILDEEYEIYIHNNTDKTILLDKLDSSSTIWLYANDVQYMPYSNRLFISNLTIEPGETNRIVIKFMKNLGSGNTSDKIKFSKVIKDYDLYIENKEAYTEFTDITINVEV